MHKTPKYPLDQFHAQYSENGFITLQALHDAHTLGFDAEDIEEVVSDLQPASFYKTMPAVKCPGAWQDVYKVHHEGVDVYIKIQIRTTEKGIAVAVVIAFKHDESA